MLVAAVVAMVAVLVGVVGSGSIDSCGVSDGEISIALL